MIKKTARNPRYPHSRATARFTGLSGLWPGISDAAFPTFLAGRRWFRSKGKKISGLALEDYRVVDERGCRALLLFLNVFFAPGKTRRETYFVPLIRGKSGRVRRTSRDGIDRTERLNGRGFRDAFEDRSFQRWLWERIRDGRPLAARKGRIVFESQRGIFARRRRPSEGIRRLKEEQSNTSLVFRNQLLVKVYRKLEKGTHPEPEMLEALARSGSVPVFRGRMLYRRQGCPDQTIGVIQDFLRHRGSGWDFALKSIAGFLEKFSKRKFFDRKALNRAAFESLSASAAGIFRLGSATAQMHAASAGSRGKAFCPEPVTWADVRRWKTNYKRLVRRVIAAMGNRKKRLCAAGNRQDFDRVMNGREILLKHAEGFERLKKCRLYKIRHHGDFHLGQVLDTPGGWKSIDFEGEPLRPLSERRAKGCALKDVGGMLRSFDYAAWVGRDEFCRRGKKAKRPRLLAEIWRLAVRRAFLDGYFTRAQRAQNRFIPRGREDRDRLVRLFEIEKAVYEVDYERNNRPDWMPVPLSGLARLLESP